jgi:hypothetical protein
MTHDAHMNRLHVGYIKTLLYLLFELLVIRTILSGLYHLNINCQRA